MPIKVTKKVKSHTRRRTLMDFRNFKVQDPIGTTYVKSHFRKKRR